MKVKLAELTFNHRNQTTESPILNLIIADILTWNHERNTSSVAEI